MKRSHPKVIRSCNNLTIINECLYIRVHSSNQLTVKHAAKQKITRQSLQFLSMEANNYGAFQLPGTNSLAFTFFPSIRISSK
mmetsp:Transcript_21538/g.32151  ORF Transcript_21538/g.32151 Transcript_21538/m.32151 type:complete len:82 (-) Transcript_21538:640-885(-)